jgi:hypothetical protein
MTQLTPRLIFALALALMIAGCGDDAAATTTGPTGTTAAVSTTTGSSTTGGATTTAAETTTTAGTTTTAAETTTTAATTTTVAPFEGDTTTKSGAIQGSPTGLLTDVRFAQREEGFTRIVFDFQAADGIPGYEVGYEPGPFRNMAEVEVPVSGSAFLAIRMFPASRVDLSVDPYVITYTGPESLLIIGSNIREIVFLEDFEANMTWIVGLDAQKPFRVGTLADPPRIFIDIED